MRRAAAQRMSGRPNAHCPPLCVAVGRVGCVAVGRGRGCSRAVNAVCRELKPCVPPKVIGNGSPQFQQEHCEELATMKAAISSFMATVEGVHDATFWQAAAECFKLMEQHSDSSSGAQLPELIKEGMDRAAGALQYSAAGYDRAMSQQEREELKAVVDARVKIKETLLRAAPKLATVTVNILDPDIKALFGELSNVAAAPELQGQQREGPWQDARLLAAQMLVKLRKSAAKQVVSLLQADEAMQQCIASVQAALETGTKVDGTDVTDGLHAFQTYDDSGHSTKPMAQMDMLMATFTGNEAADVLLPGGGESPGKTVVTTKMWVCYSAMRLARMLAATNSCTQLEKHIEAIVTKERTKPLEDPQKVKALARQVAALMTKVESCKQFLAAPFMDGLPASEDAAKTRARVLVEESSAEACRLRRSCVDYIHGAYMRGVDTATSLVDKDLKALADMFEGDDVNAAKTDFHSKALGATRTKAAKTVWKLHSSFLKRSNLPREILDILGAVTKEEAEQAATLVATYEAVKANISTAVAISMAVQALYRDVQEGEDRSVLAAYAKSEAEALSAKLPVKLGMLLAAAAAP